MKRRLCHRLLFGDKGSVLAEFIIVAPLYFLLFGGLLLFNDMLRLKNKITMLDMFVTIAGTNRLMKESGSALKPKIEKVFQSFAPQSVSSPNAFGNLYESNDGTVLSNHWNAVYGGRIDVAYKLPTTVNALLSAQRLVSGDEKYHKTPTEYRFYTDSTTGEFPDEKECRFHLIERHWQPGSGDDFDRTADAKDLLGDDVLKNVIGDAWLFTEDTLSASEASGNTSTYKQTLGDYAE